MRSCWLSQSRGGQAIFHFEGSDSISDAEKAGRPSKCRFRFRRMPLPAGSYYVSDLIGCEVWREERASAIGHVRDVQFTGEADRGTPILVGGFATGRTADSAGAGYLRAAWTPPRAASK